MQKEEKNKSSGNYSTVSFIWYLEVIARLGWPWRSSPFDTHVLLRTVSSPVGKTDLWNH